MEEKNRLNLSEEHTNLKHEEELLSSISEETKSRIYKLESELYANLATLQSISRSFEESRLDPATFKRFLKTLTKEFFKVKHELEKLGLDVKDFIKKHGFLEEFNLAIKNLEWNMEIGDSIYSILLESPGRIAVKTRNVVSSFITLSDSVKLRVQCGELSTLLNELFIDLSRYPGFNFSHPVCKEISEWQNKLKNFNPADILDERTSLELENAIQTWRNEFDCVIKKACM